MKLESVTSPENFEVGVLTRSLIANLPHVSAPDTFEQSVLNNAKAPEPSAVTDTPATSAPRPFWRAAMYSAVAAVAVVSSVMVLGSFRQEQQPAIPQVQQQTMQQHEFDTARLTQVPVSAPQATISAAKATTTKVIRKKSSRKADVNYPKGVTGYETPASDN